MMNYQILIEIWLLTHVFKNYPKRMESQNIDVNCLVAALVTRRTFQLISYAQVIEINIIRFLPLYLQQPQDL